MGDLVRLLENGQGTLAWYGSLTALTGATLVWPRRHNPAYEPEAE